MPKYLTARELSDDDVGERRVIPDGNVLRVPLHLMDGNAAAPIPGNDRRFNISDEQAQREAQTLQRVADAYQGMKERVSRGMDRHRVKPEPGDVGDVGDSGEFNRSAAAYHTMKKRLGGRWKARKQPKPVDPSWQRL